MKNFKLDKKRVCVVGTVWVLSLLLVGLVVASQTSLPYWTLNVPPATGYDFTIAQYSNGTYYYQSADGQTWANSANVSKLFDWVQGNMTVGRTVAESVLFRGNFSLSSSLAIGGNYTTVGIAGGLVAVNGLNDAMIRFSDSTAVYYGVKVEGVGGVARLNGNSAGQSSAALASGINFTRTAGSLPAFNFNFPAIYVKDLSIFDTYSAGVWCNFGGTGDGGEVRFEDVSVAGSISDNTKGVADTGGFGAGLVVWWSVYDSEWVRGVINGGNINFGFLGLGLSGDVINPSYMNGYHKIMSANAVDFSCMYVDNSGAHDTLALYNVNDSRFHDTTFNFGTAATNSYDGIKLFGGSYPSVNNVFADNLFKNYTSSVVFKFGIEEADNTNLNNLYVGNHGVVCGSGVLRVLSAGAVYANLNKGTVVTS